MEELPPGYEDTPPGFENDSEKIDKLAIGEADASVPPKDGENSARNGADDGNLYASDLTFSDLQLSPEILDALLLDLKFERPSKIQALTLPRVLSEPDRHMIAQGHNGCGKTTCFTLAMLMRCGFIWLDQGAWQGDTSRLTVYSHCIPVTPMPRPKHCRVNVEMSKPQAICMCPTRELVIQNLGVLKKMAARTNPPITARATADHEERVRGMRPPPITEHVIVGTPGTLENWISRRRLGLDGIRVLVFDEADQMMMTDGFQDVSLRMLTSIRRVSPDVQILLFSATFGDNVRNYCNKARAPATWLFPSPRARECSAWRRHRRLYPMLTRVAN